MLITNSEDVTKQVSVQYYPEENSVFGRVSYYILLEFLWEGVGWGGPLLTFCAFRMGAYSRWALIRMNTVHNTVSIMVHRYSAVLGHL